MLGFPAAIERRWQARMKAANDWIEGMKDRDLAIENQTDMKTEEKDTDRYIKRQKYRQIDRTTNKEIERQIDIDIGTNMDMNIDIEMGKNNCGYINTEFV